MEPTQCYVCYDYGDTPNISTWNFLCNSRKYTQSSLEIFHDLFDDSSIVVSPEMTADDVREWDSFNHINLIISIEAEFRIKFQAAELEVMHNVGALADRIEKKLADQGR